MMTARPTVDDIIQAPAATPRGASSDPVPASEFRAALTGLTTVVCLPAGRWDLSQLFAGVRQVPMAERFATGLWPVLATGAPYCQDALVAFDCELIEAREVGTHSVLIACGLATEQAALPAEPLVHHRRQYATTRAL
jgi:flavin reductase (NADH)/flavin reductase/chlorophenol-4-monooxygenase component 1